MNLNGLLKKIRNLFSARVGFKDLSRRGRIFLYAGDVPSNGKYEKFIGLSQKRSDARHIKHDVLKPIPLSDRSVDVFQSEDVFEHIEYEKLPAVIDEIYRILKIGGVFRLALPDYQCDVLRERCQKDESGQVIFDPGGGGRLVGDRVVDGGHVWFPDYLSVKTLLEASSFEKIAFYHYYDESGHAVTRPIDYSNGYVMRTPGHDNRVQEPFRPCRLLLTV